MSRAHTNGCPYLKHIRQTLDSLREGRDEDGWKLSRRELTSELLENSNEVDKESPSVVEPSSRFKCDMFALELLMKGNVSKRSQMRLHKSRWASYGIGYTFGNGYEASVRIGEKLHYLYG